MNRSLQYKHQAELEQCKYQVEELNLPNPGNGLSYMEILVPQNTINH